MKIFNLFLLFSLSFYSSYGQNYNKKLSIDEDVNVLIVSDFHPVYGVSNVEELVVKSNMQLDSFHILWDRPNSSDLVLSKSKKNKFSVGIGMIENFNLELDFLDSYIRNNSIKDTFSVKFVKFYKDFEFCSKRHKLRKLKALCNENGIEWLNSDFVVYSTVASILNTREVFGNSKIEDVKRNKAKYNINRAEVLSRNFQSILNFNPNIKSCLVLDNYFHRKKGMLITTAELLSTALEMNKNVNCKFIGIKYRNIEFESKQSIGFLYRLTVEYFRINIEACTDNKGELIVNCFYDELIEVFLDSSFYQIHFNGMSGLVIDPVN